MRVVVLGDAMLDRDIEGTVERICPEAPVPVLDESGGTVGAGGAARTAVLAAKLGADVALITGLGDDQAGDTVRGLLDQCSVEVHDLGAAGRTPEKIRMRCDGRTLLRLDRGGRPSAPASLGELDESDLEILACADVLLVSDYGRGMTSHAQARRAIASVAGYLPVVWDPHPRGREPVAGAALVTPNASEAARLAPEVRGSGARADAARARELRARWRAGAVAVTRGAGGALVEDGGRLPLAVPAPFDASAGDPCGAGDCLAATAAMEIARGASARQAMKAAVAAATVYVAGERNTPPSFPPRASERMAHARKVADAVRGRGGTVVATGGCFDLLHVGHVATLEAARRLGDCLIVLLNSDRSVKRLKGPLRPVVPQDDRARMLESLGCVDAVVIFDEPTPADVLGQLRPNIFAKGGDYAGEDLPESATMRRFAGQTVILPSVAGRSTTSLIERASGRPSA